jgi:hypothetical protein
MGNMRVFHKEGTEMRILIQKHRGSHNGILQWSPEPFRKFYPINYKRIQAVHNGADDPFRALEPFRKAMLKVSEGYTEMFSGSYNLETKILSVKKL